MARKMIDCRDYPSDKKCSLMLTGEEEEVLQAASEHAVSVHGYQDTPSLKEKLRDALKDEPAEWNVKKSQPAA